MDMRMNQDQELNAESLLMNYSESELTRIWRDYSEITNAAKIAQQWMKDRRSVKLNSCKDLADWVAPFM
ncbi:16S rRNA (cytosine(1402)-N(4))-methyltransferase, partial [Citrobacter freundii]|uniref:16S rRNA (cytosine(1402)-N(4))-methyltransferase n=1 Tax=Citrobacter freundii TaxID=546 RepID=UPI004044A1FC